MSDKAWDVRVKAIGELSSRLSKLTDKERTPELAHMLVEKLMQQGERHMQEKEGRGKGKKGMEGS